MNICLIGGKYINRFHFISSSSTVSGAGSQRKQTEQRGPAFLHPRHFFQLDIVSPALMGLSWGLLPGRHALKGRTFRTGAQAPLADSSWIIQRDSISYFLVSTIRIRDCHRHWQQRTCPAPNCHVDNVGTGHNPLRLNVQSIPGMQGDFLPAVGIEAIHKRPSQYICAYQVCPTFSPADP